MKTPFLARKIKRVSIFILLILGAQASLLAQNTLKPDSHFNQLCEVNMEWNSHVEYCPDGTISFNSETDRIQLHLQLVAEYLTQNTPLNLSGKQRNRRLDLIQSLKDYAESGIFPTNKYHVNRQPYFVDDAGVHCAVGQLMAVSGNEKLVADIRREHNYDYIADIRTNGVLEWANDYGFTLEELKWIQPTYPPSTNISPIANGTNGPVYTVNLDPYYGCVLFAGEFDEVDEMPCLNVGVYEDGILSCLGDGVSGIVYELLTSSTGVYVFGALENAGEVYPVAFFDGTTWTYLSIPGRDGAICSASVPPGSGQKFQVSISHSSLPGKQEIWCLLSSDVWEKKAEVNGQIYDIAAGSYGRVFAGYFDTVSVYDTAGLVDTTFSVNNVVIRTNFGGEWYGLSGELSDTVLAVEEVGGALIFGGTCSSQPGFSNICLTRYYHETFQPLYEAFWDTDGYRIDAIAYYSGSSLIIGGSFEMDAMMGTHGNNLGAYDLVSNFLEPMAIFDEPVNALCYIGGELYIGGAFLTNMGDTLNHLGRIVSTAGTDELDETSRISVYPNPFNDVINITGVEVGTNYFISNSYGAIVQQGILAGQSITGLENLAKGVYFLKFETEEGTLVNRIVK